jgi:hypothetical protein
MIVINRFSWVTLPDLMLACWTALPAIVTRVQAGRAAGKAAIPDLSFRLGAGQDSLGVGAQPRGGRVRHDIGIVPVQARRARQALGAA